MYRYRPHLTDLQAECQRVVEAAEMFESKALVSFAKFVCDIKAEALPWDDEARHFEIEAIIGDWNYEMYEAAITSKQDEFTLAMIRNK